MGSHHEVVLFMPSRFAPVRHTFPSRFGPVRQTSPSRFAPVRQNVPSRFAPVRHHEFASCLRIMTLRHEVAS